MKYFAWMMACLGGVATGAMADPIAAPTSPVAQAELPPPGALPAPNIQPITLRAVAPAPMSDVFVTSTAARVVSRRVAVAAVTPPPAVPAAEVPAEAPTAVVETPAPVAATPPPPPAKPQPIDADWRPADPHNTVVMETSRGLVILELYPDVAPRHVAQIKTLVARGFYDNLQFFRVIDWFMAQGGDPGNTGNGASDMPNLPAEFTFRRAPDAAYVRAASHGGVEVGFLGALPITTQPDVMFARSGDGKAGAWANHCTGVAGMGRDDDPNSANSQYYIMRQPYLSLDKRYTVWGRALSGLDVVRALAVGEPPAQPDTTARVRLLADIPESERPQIRVQRTDGPRFARSLADLRRKKGADFHVCDVDIAVEIITPKQ